MTSRTEAWLRVDWLRCDGYGLCGDLAPDVIELDEWRYPVIRPGPVDGRHLDVVRRAADCCPMRALILEQVDPERARR
ncbi:MAG TPA: ferredoxin [Candidatus Binatus sp.]|nr:ferredoxin [Candidatus Binatus sp.]